MRNLIAAVRRVWRLFVEDAGLAGGIAVWLALNGLLPRLGGVAAGWRGPILLAGLMVLFSLACLRSAAPVATARRSHRDAGCPTPQDP